MSDAEQRGPNYDWKHESKHYSDECERLRRLLKFADDNHERIFFSMDAHIKKLEARIAKLREALKLADDQMDYYHCEIQIPTSWQDVHKAVKQALSEDDNAATSI